MKYVWRNRYGVNSEDGERQIYWDLTQEDKVLQTFSQAQKEVVDRLVFDIGRGASIQTSMKPINDEVGI